ncbi:thiamine-phosphate kinase [Phycicoccus sp. CSK15P-2]|uniref:thiamine-phosphate kinase n=1 Tax=Phycicoccus sp. CSK15P-2 TaxID=2807627 RepID=UPI00194DE0B6|nr:thiamine-phosphate kinase [Phycicoccus sp. CSK15P-2]MBM6404793.1 thiamine-phosphate kinase [Phycicoccus sp. CSK15P-2]
MERLRDLDEASLLERVLPHYRAARPRPWGTVTVPAGDDAAVLGAPGGSVVATTDSMVRDHDWRDDWSTGHDVGVKVAVQNLADIAAMGAEPSGLLVSLVADPDTAVAWAVDLAAGVASVAEEANAPVVGGDLSSAPPGVVVVGVTALGDLRGRSPVLRSGASPGDIVAVCGSLGRSGGGLEVLRRGLSRDGAAAGLVAYHRAPRPPWDAGPAAAEGGATALVDVSDGLVTDLGRVASASRVVVELEGDVLRERFADGDLTGVLGAEEALHQVLAGGEEHALVGCFPPGTDLTGLPGQPWVPVGRVVDASGAGARVTVDGEVPDARGWDHFDRSP